MTYRSLFSLLFAGAVVATAGCARSTAAGPNGPAHAAPVAAPQLVSVALENELGGPLQSWFHFGALFVEGRQGQAYAIRLTNNTGERVEAVLTVDGRDVISGEVGDFKKQRGYVLEPFGSIRVDGFRQSFDHVATFRFSGLQDSYTARQGTPQHAGVIGVAVFREKPQRKRKSGPIAVGPGPSSGPSAFPDSRTDATPPPPAPDPFPGGASEERRASSKRSDAAAPSDAPAPSEASAPSSAPLADDGDFAAEGEASAPASRDASGSPGGFAPPPEPRNELGTEYGETRQSSVHEVEFQRKKKRKPDEVSALYYDSRRGLAARGVPVDGGAVIAGPEPQPFPSDTGFARPPR